MSDLEHLVELARGATVRGAAADAYVRDLARWVPPAPPARRWVPWLAGGFAGAAALIAIAIGLGWGQAPREADREPLRVGDRVAIVAEPGTSYRVIAASAGETRIAVDRGAITARLWHGAAPHRLQLEGGGVVATAVGTVYSLTVGPSGAVVQVHEGTVQVADQTGTHAVPAGTSFPASGAITRSPSARTLLALAAPPVAEPVQARAEPVADAGLPTVAAPAIAPRAPQVPTPTRNAATMPTQVAVKDRWRLARLLRGQGRFLEAIAQCDAIADAHDATWSPIALVEAIRIYLRPLAQPERAIDEADRMLRDWPGDALAADATQLRCEALAQLGRAAECAASPP